MRKLTISGHCSRQTGESAQISRFLEPKFSICSYILDIGAIVVSNLSIYLKMSIPLVSTDNFQQAMQIFTQISGELRDSRKHLTIRISISGKSIWSFAFAPLKCSSLAPK